MATHVALLRGINVGGKNLIRMADLKACFEANGYVDVVTYIQSGNVLFTAGTSQPPSSRTASSGCCGARSATTKRASSCAPGRRCGRSWIARRPASERIRRASATT